MAYNTDTTTEASRRSVPLPDRSSSGLWVIAGIVIVLAVIGMMVWGGSTIPVTTTTLPQVENNVTVAPPAEPAPSTTTTMDAQPPVKAPATTTITPAPAETPPAAAPAPAQQPVVNP